MSDPRCAGLPGSTLGAGDVFDVENGASPLGFCGVKRKPNSPAPAEALMGDEKAVSDEPTIMARIMSSMI